MLFSISCSTDQCACDGWEQRDFPSNKIDVSIPSAGQARVTSHGLDYVESQVPYLITQFLPDGLSFCIPRDTSGNPDLCVASTCSNGQPGCQVDLTLDDQSLTPVPNDTLEISITIGDVNERLNFDYDTFLGNVNCYVQLFKDGASTNTPAVIMGDVEVTIGVDGASPTQELTVSIGQVNVDLSDVDFNINGRGNVGDTIACEGASLVRGLFRNRIESEIQTLLNDTVAGIADEQLCTRCGAGFDACSDGTCEAGICRRTNGQCVPRPLGVEGRLTVGTFLDGYTQEPTAALDVLGKAGDHAIVDSGVSVGLRAAVDTRSLSQCIPVDPTRRPSSRVVPVSDVINANTKPGGGEFHLGVGIHKSVVEQALWSVWASGVGCIEITGDDVDILSATTFSLVAPSIKDLASNGAYAMVALVPQKAPEVELGANRIMPSGNSYSITEPLLTVNWADLDFHVFLYAQDRLMRMFSLRVDLALPVAIAPDGSGQLVPVLGALDSAVQNIRARRTELLAEDDSRITDLIPTVIGLAGPQLAGALPDVIELPEFLGFALALDEGDIAAADNDEFLAVFATLERTTQNVTELGPQPLILEQQVDYSNVLPSGLVRPKVHLKVGHLPRPLATWDTAEYSYKVNDGIWSMYTTDSNLVIDDPVLVLPGTHTIAVRARAKGLQGSNSSPMYSSVTIDAEPLISLNEKLSEYVIKKHTVETQPHPISRAVEPPKAPRTSGCTAGGATPFATLILLALLGLRRRRLLAVLGLALMVFGCKGDVVTNADQVCFGPGCRVNQACEADVDCGGICPTGNSGICVDNACQCVSACGDGCGEGEFCCLTTSTCDLISPSCDQACDPGYEARVVGEPNRDTCSVEGACECVPLPPVPIGVHGQFLDLASNGAVTAVAAYNDTYADLMIGEVQSDRSINWEFVAGVPTDGDIVGDPNFRGGRDGRGDKAGTHLAITMSDDGTVHAVFRDDENDGLAYLSGTFGNWSAPITIASDDDAKWPSIALASGVPHIVYSAVTGGESKLRHFRIDAGAAVEVGDIAASPEDELTDRGFARRMGMFPDLTATPDGGLFVVFYDGNAQRVGRSLFSGTSWSDPVFLAAGTGPYASGRVDASGAQHVAFQLSSGIRYSKFEDGGGPTTSLIIGTVRDGTGEYYSGPTGADLKLMLAGSNIVVAFHDPFDLSLVKAFGDGTSNESWTVEVNRASGTAAGLYATVCRDCSLVADFVIDRQSDPWGYVRIEEY